MTKFKENLIVVLATLFLTWTIILFVNNTNLATNVLWESMNQQKAMQDMQFVFNSGDIYLICQKNIDNIASVSMELMFDSSKVKLSKDSFDSPFDISLSKKEWDNGYDIILQNINTLSKWDTVLKIKDATKKQFDNINVGHIQVIDNNWNIMDLTSSRK